MSGIVIADTSCLIALSKLERLSILKALFENVQVTDVVQAEFQLNLPEWFSYQKNYDQKLYKSLCLGLDAGEASSIALACSHKNPLLLMDERKGRKMAQALGLETLGTIGLLSLAFEEGLIESLKEELTKLKALDFYVSDSLLRKVLKKYDTNL